MATDLSQVFGIGEEGWENEEEAFVAVCDQCGATHVVAVDFLGLGIVFSCALVGESCEGEDAGASSSTSQVPATSALPKREEFKALTADEKRALFQQYVLQQQRQQTDARDLHKGVLQVMQAKVQKERYRDNEIVTHKGERFIKTSLALDPGAGCQLGGIIGWRTKAGRQGLGIRKMSKEEADRVSISNKERAHTRKASGGHKGAYVCENRTSQHN